MNNTNDNVPYGSPTPPQQGQNQAGQTQNPAPAGASPVHPSQPMTGVVSSQPTQPNAGTPVPPPAQPTQNYGTNPNTQPGQVQQPHAGNAYSQPPAGHNPGSQQVPINQHPQHANQPGQPHNQHPVYQTPPPSAPKKSGGGAKTFLFGFLGAALACIIAFSGFGIYNAVTGGSDTGGSTVIGSSSSSSINADDTDLTLPEAVAQKALPSVVNIDVYTAQTSTSPFGGTSSSDGTLTETSLGSGIILSADGYIMTNYHVIEGADALEVTIGDQTYKADVVGTDASSDIAVIKAQNASGLTPIEIGSSSDLIIGEWVMTIGSPFGLEQSVATGIVSATSRSEIMQSETSGEITVYTNMIQTDAAINPGNSGGALVDSDGKLIGINTLITSYSGNYSGVGFAIPVDYAINIAQQLIDGKTPTHAQLGVSLSTVDAATAKRYGLAVDSGAYVTQVYSGSAADKAGLQVGDIITKFDGKAVTSASDLMLDIRSKNPGDTVTLEINRDGQTQSVSVTLGSDADSNTVPSSQGSYTPQQSLQSAA